MVPAAWPEEKEPGRSPSGREVPRVRRGSTCDSLRVPRDSTYGHGAPRVTVGLHIQPWGSTRDKGLRTGRAEVDARRVGTVPLREVRGRVHVTELWTCTGATSL